MHPAKAEIVVPAVDPSDDDVTGQRWHVGIAVAEHVREQCAKVIAVNGVGPEDDLLACRACVHLQCHLV
ncbi:hypothetical protein D3C80_1942270 [compost metagenome]